MTMFYAATSGNSANNSGSSDSDTPYVTGTGYTVFSGNVVTLSGSPDLSGIPNDGSQTIYIDGATNSQRKIFKIVAGSIDNVNKRIEFDLLPTVASPGTSTWRIGGRILWPTGTTVWHSEAALFAGDILEFVDSPNTRTNTFFTCRTAGDNTNPIIIRGRAGSLKTLQWSQNAAGITHNNQGNWHIDNLKFHHTGASGGALNLSAGWQALNLEISQAGGAGIGSASQCAIINCNIHGASGAGISLSGNTAISFVFGNYVHDNTGDGINVSGAQAHDFIVGNIIESNGGKGVSYSSTTTTTAANLHVLLGNTIWDNADSGLQVDDDYQAVHWWNNIIAENGSAAGQYNVEWTQGTAERVGTHDYNVIYLGSGGGGNYSSMTLAAHEYVTDPGLTSPASGDFTISDTGSAKGAGAPASFLGLSFNGYPDIGAVQRLETGGAGGMIRHPGMSGGLVG